MSPESEQITATAGMARSPSEDNAEPSPAMQLQLGEDSITNNIKENSSNPNIAEAGAGSIDSIKFDGKILYNPDGSTYIIEDQTDLGDNDSLRQEGCIVEDTEIQNDQEDTKSYPQIANAFVVSRSSAYYNALYGQAMAKLLQERNVPETPIVHSFRVLSARKRESLEPSEVPRSEPPVNPTLHTMVPVKPILMCFICKLSFACSKSFANHCGDSHSLNLSEDEQSVLDDKNASAIVQYVGKDQEVTLSFLEPFSGTSQPPAPPPPLNPAAALPNPASLNNLVSLMNNSASQSTTPVSTGMYFFCINMTVKKLLIEEQIIYSNLLFFRCHSQLLVSLATAAS